MKFPFVLLVASAAPLSVTPFAEAGISEYLPAPCAQGDVDNCVGVGCSAAISVMCTYQDCHTEQAWNPTTQKWEPKTVCYTYVCAVWAPSIASGGCLIQDPLQ